MNQDTPSLEFVFEFVTYPANEKGQLSVFAPDAIRALNDIHRLFQESLRRRPDEYQLTKMAQRYKRNAYGKGLDPSDYIESDYDLPKSPNPDLTAQAQERKAKWHRSRTNPTEAMPFLDNIKIGKEHAQSSNA